MKNKYLKSLVERELLPLEDQCVKLFVENRRKGQLIDIIGQRLEAFEEMRENIHSGNTQ
jgi:hypothetical protein